MHLNRKKLFKNKIKIFARGIIILGGHGNKQRFQNFQQYVNQMIDNYIQYNTITNADLNLKKTNVQSTLEKIEEINHYQTIVHQRDM
jgi:hypothetical protein